MGSPEALLMLGSVSMCKALLGHGKLLRSCPQTLGNPRNKDCAPVGAEKGVSGGRAGFSGAVGWSASASQRKSKSDSEKSH